MLLRNALTPILVLLLSLPFGAHADLGIALLKVNLREQPDLNSRIVGVLEKGTPTRIVGLVGQSEFAKVKRLSDGLEGYLRLRNLELKPEATASRPTTPARPAKPAPAAAEQRTSAFFARQPTPLRQTPTADGAIVAQLKADEAITLLAHHGAYAKIKRIRDGKIGYLPAGALILGQSAVALVVPSPHQYE